MNDLITQAIECLDGARAINILQNVPEEEKTDTMYRYALARAYFLLNDFSNFFVIADDILEDVKTIDISYYVGVSEMLGTASFNRGDLLHAVDYYLDAVDYCTESAAPEYIWMLSLNVAAIYISVGKMESAIYYTKKAHDYVSMHQDIRRYESTMAQIYMNYAKAYLTLDVNKAALWDGKIDNECNIMGREEQICLYCFKTCLYIENNDSKTAKYYISKLDELLSNSDLTNVYDDLYLLLDRLLDANMLADFILFYNVIENYINNSTFVFMERKFLLLKLRYDEISKSEEYLVDCEKFYALSKKIMRDDDQISVKAIELRSKLHESVDKNYEIKNEANRLRDKAEKDGLTRLNNRLCFNEQSPILFEKAKAEGKSFAVEILDIDFFKQYNDNYGHQKGDECIKTVANTIRNMENKHDGVTTYRYGGDEFIIIYVDIPEKEVDELVMSLREDMHKIALEHKYSKLPIGIVTISQGACWDIPKKNETFEEYLKKADDNLYKIKQQSKDSLSTSRFRTGLFKK